MLNPKQGSVYPTNNWQELILTIDNTRVDEEISQVLSNVKQTKVARKMSQLRTEVFSPEANHILLNPELAQTSIFLI